MWSEEQIKDATDVLWSASENGDVQKVTTTDDKGKKECYLMAAEVTYTDPLYLKALDKLVSDGKFSKGSEADDRVSFKRGSCSEKQASKN